MHVPHTTMTKSLIRRLGLCLVLAFVAHTSVFASFHFARIAEIYTGTAADPNAQYIVIVPYANSQSLFASVEIDVYDAAGIPMAAFAVFAANLPSTATNQKSILVATPEAVTAFGVAADQVATGSLPASGLVCFRKGPTAPDCVAYGDYTGDPLVGGSPTGAPAPSIPSGAALRRDFGVDATLQATDDTHDSASDFALSAAIPENFAGIRLEDVQAIGSVTFGWSSTSPSHSIHKTSDPKTVRTSAAVDTTSATTWTDPNPSQFPNATYYIIKPN